jgi:hypothetical protein
LVKNLKLSKTKMDRKTKKKSFGTTTIFLRPAIRFKIAVVIFARFSIKSKKKFIRGAGGAKPPQFKKDVVFIKKKEEEGGRGGEALP